ncbi:MAG: hypothetical protein IKS68_00220 [Mailhella sp.]|nr:hypothetical protein [Mailhella sp.]
MSSEGYFIVDGRAVSLVTPDEDALLTALRQHQDGGALAKVLASVCIRLHEARAKHGRFAENVFHALGFFSEEHGESVREATKQAEGWEKRMDSELMDTIVVAMRILLREYEHGEDA